VLREDVLEALYEKLEELTKSRPTSVYRGFSAEDLVKKCGKRSAAVRKALHDLQKKRFVTERTRTSEAALWTFTPEGLQEAHRLVLNQRLWDLYHMNQNQYQDLNIDVNQEELAPQLTQEALSRMLAQLSAYDLTPRLADQHGISFLLQPSNRGGLSL
jgi:manganese/zinc/iron transport system permease protein